MSHYTVVIPSATPGAGAGSPPYITLDDALNNARFMLANGAASAWIVDAEGVLVLPAAQVKSRLDALDEASRSSVQTRGVDRPRPQPAWPV
jgi:hypothetical protein